MQKGNNYGVATLDKVMIHIPGEIEQMAPRFLHITQDGIQFKTYELLIGIFHLIFSGHS